MEFQTLLESRRSVRSYDASKTVTREQIKEIVEAGILAPSWKNSQTARYYCVIDEAAKEKFAKVILITSVAMAGVITTSDFTMKM